MPGNFEIQVVFPSGFWATFQGTASDINAQGFSPVFSLSAGGAQNVPAGIQSTTVTTTQDDPLEPYQNMVTLRDAIETANNGEGLHQGNTLADVTFVNPLNGQPLTGTITLQQALDPIAKSYKILGPATGSLTIQGQGNATNPFGIFKVNAGVTSTISNLTITGGFLTKDDGGGISNSGNLTLSSDIVKNNQAADGGGIFNASNATLTVQASQITGNTANGTSGLELPDKTLASS